MSKTGGPRSRVVNPRERDPAASLCNGAGAGAGKVALQELGGLGTGQLGAEELAGP